MGYIYKITNNINNKIYIGQTSLSLSERFKQHCKDAFNEKLKNRPLYRAINKYGIEHFTIEAIEECPNNELAEKEIYWIAYYKGYEDGYNATRGGEGTLIYNHELIVKRLLEHPYAIDIAKEFNCSQSLIYLIAKENNIKLKNKGNDFFIKNKKMVHQYTKDGVYIQSFDSTVSAAKWCCENNKCNNSTPSGARSHIGEVARGQRKSAYGYIWKYEDEK